VLLAGGRWRHQAILSSTGGVANRNALYLIDTGLNDVRFALANSAVQDPDTYLKNTAGALADSIKSLQANGARYIIVPAAAIVPDARLTVRTATEFYNNQVWSDLSARGVNFIPADFNSVRAAVAQNGLAFGFTFTGNKPGQTACPIPTDPKFPQTAWAIWCSPNSPVSKLNSGADKYFFADDDHLSTAGQKIEADYFYSLLTAPSQISMLAETAVKTRMQTTADIQTQIDLSQAHRGPQNVNAWVSGDINSLTIDNFHGMANDSNTFGSVAAGVDHRFAPGLIAGVAFSLGRLQSNLGEFGNFKQNEQSFSVYAAYSGGPLWGTLIGTVGHLDYDSNRITPIGITMQSNRGTTTGENWSAAVQGGYKFLSGSMTHGPIVGFLHQDLTVDGFTESGSFTSLAFGSQTRESSVGQFGYRASLDWSRYHPFAQVLWNHEFEGGRNVTASLTTVVAPSYSLPAVVLGKDWGSAAAGLTIDAGSGVNLVGKATADFGQSSAIVYGGQLGLNVAF
jgi:outer membrane lipase/esterase